MPRNVGEDRHGNRYPDPVAGSMASISPQAADAHGVRGKLLEKLQKVCSVLSVEAEPGLLTPATSVTRRVRGPSSPPPVLKLQY